MMRGCSGHKPPGARGRAHPRGLALRVSKRRPGAALRESEARFRATFAQAAVGIAHVDPTDGSFLLVNDKLCEILGYTRSELMQKTFKDVSHPDDRDRSDAPRARLNSGEIATFSLDKRYRRKDGEAIWVRLTVSLARRADDKADYEIAVFEDITAHQRAEAALRESEERYRRIAATALDAVVTIDAEGLVTDWNPRAETTFGWTAREAIGRSLANLIVPPEYRAAHSRGLRHYLATGEGPVLNKRIEVPALHRDGHMFPVELAISPLKMGDHYVFSAFIRDIGERKQAEQALRESEERFQYAVRGSLAGLWDWNLATDHYYLSPRSKAILGYGEHELPDQRSQLLAHLYPEDRQRVEDAVKRHFERRASYNIEFRARHRDGRTIWCHDVGQAVWDEAGRVTRFSGSISDITARKEAEARVVQLIAERDTLLENAPVGIAFLKERQVMQCNQAFAQMLGYERAELLGRSTRNLYESEAVFEERGSEAYRVIAEQGSLAADAPMRRKDGSLLWVHHRLSPVDRSDLAQGLVWVIQDVSERKRAEERLFHLAHHDILTELPNRSLFRDRLNQALAQARRDDSLVGMMFIDIDRFKVTNDTLGHEVGDRLLRAVADRLNTSLRAGDTVARFGGDEFAVILPGIDTARAAGNVAQKILSVLAKPVAVGEHQVYVSASVGVTVYPTDSEDPEALIRNADIAMYRAKEQGGNTYQYFTEEINAKALRYLKLETGLRRALAHGEFRLHYQPRVAVASGRVTGIEALLRWQSPEHGLQPPAEFVPLLEESGLIIPVGEWVLATACRQAKAWEQVGLPRVPIAVNVSARQFRRGNLPQTVRRVLRDTGLSPGQLELEITESAMMLDAGDSIPALGELKALGVGLSIDDFGTGYSSLNYLKRFDVDSLKIDRSFVKDIGLDADNDTITMAIIAVAHALGCKIIAEGVETRAQLEFLSGQGCDEYQGYLFSKPLDADAFEALWRSRSADVATLDRKRAIG